MDDTPEARLRAALEAKYVGHAIAVAVTDIRAVLDRLARAEEALQFYSCHDGCNDCTENERDLIGCGWTARAALRGKEG